MENLPRAHRDSFLGDLCAAQVAFRNVDISDARTVNLYEQRMSLCTKMQIDHMLEDPDLPAVGILKVYGHRVRHGVYCHHAYV